MAEWLEEAKKNPIAELSLGDGTKTIKGAIHQAFQQIVYGWNQPASNRGFQSPFENISYYDSNYYKALFEDFSELSKQKFDGMIVTGAPIETMAYEDVEYWPEIMQIFDWARTHVTSTLYICNNVKSWYLLNILSSHFCMTAVRHGKDIIKASEDRL